jgi:hypothetical protein
MEPRNRFQGMNSALVPSPHRLFTNSSSGYIGWRNSFLGINSWAPQTFKNTGSDLSKIVQCTYNMPAVNNSSFRVHYEEWKEMENNNCLVFVFKVIRYRYNCNIQKIVFSRQEKYFEEKNVFDSNCIGMLCKMLNLLKCRKRYMDELLLN